jgi:predicted ArsR family transcriptional regulator
MRSTRLERTLSKEAGVHLKGCASARSPATAKRVKERVLVVLVLRSHPEGVRMGQVRKTLGLSASPVRRVLEELQKEERARRQGTLGGRSLLHPRAFQAHHIGASTNGDGRTSGG